MPHRTSPIARRLTWMNILASGTALMLAGVMLIVYDYVTFQDRLVRNRSVLAQIVGANTVSALTFDDPPTAERTLAALRAVPRVEAGGPLPAGRTPLCRVPSRQ